MKRLVRMLIAAVALSAVLVGVSASPAAAGPVDVPCDDRQGPVGLVELFDSICI
jgi:hypothetical protein